MKKHISKFLLNTYKLSYKRLGIMPKLLRAIIPLTIKTQFIMLDKGKNIWGFAGTTDEQLKKAEIVHFVSIKNDHINGKKLGSAKDVKFKKEIFGDLFKEKYLEFKCPAGDNVIAKALGFKKYQVQFAKLCNGTTVYIDIPGTFPKTINKLKSDFPHLIVVYRAHNPEPLHNFDKFLTTRNFKWLVKAILAYCSDKKVINNVDFVDAISKSDINLYWSKICTSEQLKKIRCVPYALSHEDRAKYERAVVEAKKHEKCALLMGSVGKMNPLNDFGIEKFFQHRTSIMDQLKLNRVLATGNYSSFLKEQLEEIKVEVIGNVDEISDVLSGVSYLIDITGRGHGFKTKYLDAICAGARIIVSEHYCKRIPLELLPFIISYNKKGELHEYSQVSKRELDNYRHIVLDRLYSRAKSVLIQNHIFD